MRTYFLNPSIGENEKYIREGRCMQKASSWVAIWPPLALATLASIAEKRGPVRLVDGNIESLTITSLLADIKEFGPDLIVINTGFPSIDADMNVAKELKEALPDIKIMAFGVYFALLEKEGFLNYPFLDFCIVGEPEDTFDEIICALDERRKDFDRIKGLIYKDDSGVHITGEHRQNTVSRQEPSEKRQIQTSPQQ
jgi:anaerobic magnesium-protoporphyrin IX monomethyl ester cyclase